MTTATRSGLVTIHGAHLVTVAGRRTLAKPQCFSERARRFVRPKPVAFKPTERLLVATRLHWFLAAKMVASGMVVVPLVMFVSVILNYLSLAFWQVQAGLWAMVIVHEVRMGYGLLDWFGQLVVGTDRRVLVSRGILTTHVSGINLATVTRFEVHQTVWGKLFRFGTLNIEFAGRHGLEEQLLKWVPYPVAFHDEVTAA